MFIIVIIITAITFCYWDYCCNLKKKLNWCCFCYCCSCFLCGRGEDLTLSVSLLSVTSNFSFQSVLHDWFNKGHGMFYPA